MTADQAIAQLENTKRYFEGIADAKGDVESTETAIAAIKTLDKLGYTYNGAELWKPPLGKPPKLGRWISHTAESWENVPSHSESEEHRKCYRRTFICSECRKASATPSPYCPQCGAKNIKEGTP